MRTTVEKKRFILFRSIKKQDIWLVIFVLPVSQHARSLCKSKLLADEITSVRSEKNASPPVYIHAGVRVS